MENDIKNIKEKKVGGKGRSLEKTEDDRGKMQSNAMETQNTQKKSHKVLKRYKITRSG